MTVYPEIFKSLKFLKNEIKVITLESRNLMSFFYLLIEIAKIKEHCEMLFLQNREIKCQYCSLNINMSCDRNTLPMLSYRNFIPSGEKANADTNHKILRTKLPFMMSCNC